MTEPPTDPAALLRPLLDTAAAHGHAMPDPTWVVDDFLLESRCTACRGSAYASVMRIMGQWEVDAWGVEQTCQVDSPDYAWQRDADAAIRIGREGP